MIDLVARWPGATHDQTVFNRSEIKQKFEFGTFGDSLLVGDSGYANTSYLITPYLNTPSPAHQLYNESVMKRGI